MSKGILNRENCDQKIRKNSIIFDVEDFRLLKFYLDIC